MILWESHCALFLFTTSCIKTLGIVAFNVFLKSMELQGNMYSLNFRKTMVKLNYLTFGCSICPLNFSVPIGKKYLVKLMQMDAVNLRLK